MFRGTANYKTLLTLYKQFSRPVMKYVAVVNAGDCESAINITGIAEREALRFALRPSPRTSNNQAESALQNGKHRTFECKTTRS